MQREKAKAKESVEKKEARETAKKKSVEREKAKATRVAYEAKNKREREKVKEREVRAIERAKRAKIVLSDSQFTTEEHQEQERRGKELSRHTAVCGIIKRTRSGSATTRTMHRQIRSPTTTL